MLTYHMENLLELRQKFDPTLVNKSLERAVQVAATKLRTRVSREIRKLYTIKAGDIGRSVTLRRLASGHAGLLEATHGRILIYTGRMIGLDKFNARPKQVRTPAGKRRGVTVQVRKDRGRKVVKGGFVAGTKGVIFKRQGPDRLPIERLFGPSIAHMAGNETVGRQAEAQVGTDAAIEFDRYLTYLMGKA